jgi:hypothetical protein
MELAIEMMSTNVDKMNNRMHEITDRFDRLEGTMKTDVLTIDGDCSSIAQEVDEHTNNTSNIDTCSIDKRLTRIELLLFRTPVSDFLKIDMELERILPKLVPLPEVPEFPSLAGKQPGSFEMPLEAERTYATEPDERASHSESNKEGEGETMKDQRKGEMNDEVDKNMKTDMENVTEAEQDDNDTIEEASGDDKMSLGSGDDKVDPAEGAPEWFKQYAEKTLARLDNIVDEAKGMYRQCNSEPGS